MGQIYLVAARWRFDALFQEPGARKPNGMFHWKPGHFVKKHLRLRGLSIAPPCEKRAARLGLCHLCYRLGVVHRVVSSHPLRVGRSRLALEWADVTACSSIREERVALRPVPRTFGSRARRAGDGAEDARPRYRCVLKHLATLRAVLGERLRILLRPRWSLRTSMLCAAGPRAEPRCAGAFRNGLEPHSTVLAQSFDRTTQAIPCAA